MESTASSRSTIGIHILQHRQVTVFTMAQKPETPEETLVELHNRLDSLWTTYLTHLDAYVTSQTALQQNLRAGFLSLARANFNARNGRRYGKDWYHERAVAGTRFEVAVEGGSGRVGVDVVEWKGEGEEAEAGGREAGEEVVVQMPSPPATPDPEDDSILSEKSTMNDDAEKESGDPNLNDDEVEGTTQKPPLEATPLQWFGILVPRELRQAQTSFSSAVRDSVAPAVNAAKGLRETEVEIRKLRKDIRKAEKASKSAA